MPVHIRPNLLGAAIAASLLSAGVEHSLAGGEWPDGPYKEWFQNLQRPDNDQHPERRIDPKSLSCCGAADLVKTRFKVESGGGQYPEDRWFAWRQGPMGSHTAREDCQRVCAKRQSLPIHVGGHDSVLRPPQGWPVAPTHRFNLTRRSSAVGGLPGIGAILNTTSVASSLDKGFGGRLACVGLGALWRHCRLSEISPS